MRNKTTTSLFALAFLFCLSFPVKAGSFFDAALRFASELLNDDSPVEVDPSYKVDIPKDLPNHWRLSALPETVFGGEILLAETGNRSKTKILLVHGLGVSGMRDWISVVPSLEEKYHVFLIDLPGFGASKTPPGKFSPTNYARLINEVKAHISPNETITVVGHSMGGAVTLRYAEKYPTHINKIILVDAAGVLERTAFMKHNAKIPVVFSISDLQEILNGVEDYGQNLVEVINTFPDVTRFLFTDTLWAKVLGAYPNINAALALIQENYSSALKSVRSPVGIIWGDKDSVTPLRTGKVLAYHLENAELQVIKGAEHTPMKSHEHEFNHQLSGLLRGNLSKNNPVSKSVPYQKKLRCKNEKGKTYSGNFEQIEIENCQGIRLVNVNTAFLSVTNSNIELEDVTIKSSDIGVQLEASILLATNFFIDAKTGVVSNASRMDIAGGEIKANETAILVEEKSRFIFSVSELNSPKYRGSAHGVFQFENVTLDDHL